MANKSQAHFHILKLSLFLLIFAPSLGRAQVDVSISLSDSRILQGEPLYGFLKIVNNAGKDIKVGDFPGWLDIEVEQKSDGVAVKIGSLTHNDGLLISAGQTQNIPLQINELYDLMTVSRYTVTARLRIQSFENPFESKSQFFDVVSGTKIWKQNYSAPSISGIGGTPAVFTYNLMSNTGRHGKKLLFQIKDTDPDRIIRTVPICKMISFSKPEAKIDPASNLHILCQYGRSSYTYNIYNPKGDLLLRTTYKADPAKPFLKKNLDGIIEVKGGKRIPMETDFLPKSLRVKK